MTLLSERAHQAVTVLAATSPTAILSGFTAPKN